MDAQVAKIVSTLDTDHDSKVWGKAGRDGCDESLIVMSHGLCVWICFALTPPVGII